MVYNVEYFMSQDNLSEAKTRIRLIDPLLIVAGWDLNDHTKVLREVPVDGYDKEPWNGVTDYCLYDSRNNVLAVVEAKKASRNPREADEQLRKYINDISKKQEYTPFGFMSNGVNTYFWEVGLAHPRLVAGFFSPDDLNRLLFLRQNHKPLNETLVNRAIASRPYQQEAVRRVCEVFADGKRRALLVMATGTGKTRTTMALIDIFLKTNQARNILFLADRDALVEQALSDGFKAHLPNEPRDRIYTHNIDTSKRLFVATEQTMNVCFTKFSPGFFDLIIFDEAHRSIFQRFSEVMDYFDARMVGLTATPASFIDRDTFRVFDCANSTPTFFYEYKTAVNEKYLVDFSLYQAQTGFQRKGIKGIDLSEEDKNALVTQGIDPDAIDYSGTDIEVLVSNKDTIRKQWEEIWDACLKDKSGQLPGKTIIFAMTKEHAQRIRGVFEEMYPQHLDLVQVITSGVERVRDGSYGDGLITKFKKNNLPRIAISVDMLDTGVDVPEVVNLVFMKPVQSQIKMWQMIGRGTRSNAVCMYHERLPEGKKTEFKIIDFWQNNFEKEADGPVQQIIPVLVSIFNTRIKILECTERDKQAEDYALVVSDLRLMIARIPVDCFSVRKVWPDIEDAWGDEFWTLLTKDKIEFLRLKIGPLLRFVGDVDVAAETFTSKVERLRYQAINGRVSVELLQSIAEDVSLLPEYILKEAKYKTSVDLCLSNRLASATPKELRQVITDLAGVMRNRRNRQNTFIQIDLPDFIDTRGLISIGEGGEQIHVEEYRKRVEQKVLSIIDKHPAIEAIRQGKEVSEEDLISLEKTLHEGLAGGDIHLSELNIKRAYGLKVNSFLGFIKHILSLDAIPEYSSVVQRCFENFIMAHSYSGDQILFLRAVQSVFLQKRKLVEADLYEPPLTNFGRNAVDKLFTADDVRGLLKFAETIEA